MVALIMSLVWTFPNRQLKTFIEGQARKSGVPLTIGAMELRGLGGVTLTDLRVVIPAAKAPLDDKKKGDSGPAPEPTIVRLDELRADISLLPLFGDRYEVDFELSLGDGVLEDGRVVVSNGRKVIDVEVGNIDSLPIAKLGIGRRIVAAAPKMSGELDGNLSGKLNIHWGGSVEDFTGNIELELADAVIRKPELALQGGLKLADLRMGALTLDVRIDKKKKIKVLSGRKGSDKATAVSLEGVDMFGKDIELVVEDRSHILIPPGKHGLRTASMWVHFAFALPQPKDDAKPKKADADEKGDAEAAGKEPASERLKWSQVMKFAGSKLKPFERNGYIGMTCTGILKRPSCKPALPQVTVGTRRKARSDARNNKKKVVKKKEVKPTPEPPKPDAKAGPKAEDEKAADKPTPPQRPGVPDKANIEARPIARPGAQGGKIVPRQAGKGARAVNGDGDEEEAEEPEEGADEDRERDDREERYEDEEEVDDEGRPREKAAKSDKKPTDDRERGNPEDSADRGDRPERPDRPDRANDEGAPERPGVKRPRPDEEDREDD